MIFNFYSVPDAATTLKKRINLEILDRLVEQENCVEKMVEIYKNQIAHSSSVIATQPQLRKRHDMIMESATSLRFSKDFL